MFKVQDRITHRRQEKGFSCAAAAVAMLLGENESKIRPLVGTTSEGTHIVNVHNFLIKNELVSQLVSIKENYFKLLDDLILWSYKFPIISSATYRSKGQKRGRPITRHHAALIVDGMVYDSSENKEMTLEAYISTFNKELVFNSLVIVESERPNYLKNMRENP